MSLLIPREHKWLPAREEETERANGFPGKLKFNRETLFASSQSACVSYHSGLFDLAFYLYGTKKLFATAVCINQATLYHLNIP